MTTESWLVFFWLDVQRATVMQLKKINTLAWKKIRFLFVGKAKASVVCV